MSYGIKYRTSFVEGRHDARDKVWDEKELEYKANNQMEWFLVEVSKPGRYGIVQN